MEQSYVNADISILKAKVGPAESSTDDKGFMVASVRLPSPGDFTPFKFDGSIFFICLEGAISLTLDNSEIQLNGPSAAASHPDVAVKSIRTLGDAAAKILLIAISRQYFFDLKLDLGEILGHIRFDKFKPGPFKPGMPLRSDEARIIEEHCSLIKSVHDSSIALKKDHYNLLLTSVIYILNRALTAHLNATVPARQNSIPASRSATAFADFMKLAVENFERERGIGFYADKMCLTPKYLSKLIKENCGSSASQIIDNLVIAKAKNLLKHTDLSVKVLSARLHFSTQSSFNKFFKAKTGMSPLKFRNL